VLQYSLHTFITSKSNFMEAAIHLKRWIFPAAQHVPSPSEPVNQSAIFHPRKNDSN